jgi:hypothetical protein
MNTFGVAGIPHRRVLAFAVVLVLYAGLATAGVEHSLRSAGSSERGTDVSSGGAIEGSGDEGGAENAGSTVAAVDGAQGGSAPGSTAGTRAARATSGGAAGSAAGGSTASPAGARYVAGIRGIDPKTVRIGVRYVTQESAAAFGAATGIANISPGDTKAEAQIMVDDINSRGGLGGLRIEPFFIDYDASKVLARQSAAEAQRHCEYFANDAKVFAAVSAMPSGVDLPHCMAASKMPYVQDGVLPYYDDDFMSATYGYLFTPAEPNASRMTRFWIGGLVGQGYFAPGSKVGLVRLSGVTLDRVANQDIKPELARIGHPVQAEAVLTQPEHISAGVLQFRAAGISHVVILDDNSLVGQVWMHQAESQGYRPRYGLSSLSVPALLARNMPPNQLKGAVGVGWYHPFDAASVPASEIGPAERRCVDLMRRRGVTTNDPVSYGLMIYTCDVFWFLEAAFAKAPRFTEAGFLGGAEALGDWASPGTFAARFGSRRLDGTAAVRNFAYQSSCNCFGYAGTVYAVG